MAIIKFKRGQNAAPAHGSLNVGEPAVDTTKNKFYIKTGSAGSNSDVKWVGAEIDNTVTWTSASEDKLATQAAIATYYPSQVTATAPNTGTLYPIFSNSSSAGAVTVSVDSGISYDAAGNTLTVGGDLAVNGGEITTTSGTFEVANTAATTKIGSSTASNSTTTVSGVTIGIGTTSATRQIGCTFAGSGGENLFFYSNYNNDTADDRTVNFGGNVRMSAASTVKTTLNLGAGMTNIGASGLSGIVTEINLGTANSNSASIVNFNTAAAVRSAKELRFNASNNTTYVAFKAPATVTNSNVYTLPDAVASSTGQVLRVKTLNGNDAVLEWGTVSSTASTVDVDDISGDDTDTTSTTNYNVGMYSGTSNSEQTYVDSDGLLFTPGRNRLIISGRHTTNNDGSFNTCPNLGTCPAPNYYDPANSSTYGQGVLEFRNVDTSQVKAGAFRFLNNAEETLYYSYVLPANTDAAEGKILRIKANPNGNQQYYGATGERGNAYFLEWADYDSSKISNLAGGGPGSIPYQSALNTTTFLSDPNVNGAVLTYNDTSNVPEWTASSGSLNSNIARVNGATFGTGSIWNGTQIGLSYGGTGATNAQGAINNLAGGTVTSGYYLRGNGTNVVMSAIQASDVPVLNQNTTGSAATLTTSRTFQTDLGSTSTASFNGSANVTPGVTGILAVANGGTGTATGSITGTGALTFTASNNNNINLTTTGTGVVVINNSRITGLADLTSSSPGSDAANKNYVDAVAQGLHVHASVRLATTTNLSADYNNQTDGVGATLTGSSNGVLPNIDGFAASVGDRILVKNQTTQTQNGIYTVTNLGSASTKYVLTRATDFDTSAEIDGGDFLFVTGGSTLASTGWVQTTSGVVVGTGFIVFAQFSGAGTYTAANGIRLSGSQFKLGSDANTDTSLAQGSLLYGNGSYVTSLAPSVTNSPTNNYVLTYNTSTNTPQWVAPSTITAGKVSVGNVTNDATCFLTFVTANAAGDYQINTNSSIAYDSTNNSLDVTIDGGTY